MSKISEYMLNGAATGAWIIGLLVTLGLFALLVALVCMVMIWVLNEADRRDAESDDKAKAEAKARRADAAASWAEEARAELTTSCDTMASAAASWAQEARAELGLRDGRTRA